MLQQHPSHQQLCFVWRKRRRLRPPIQHVSRVNIKTKGTEHQNKTNRTLVFLFNHCPTNLCAAGFAWQPCTNQNSKTQKSKSQEEKEKRKPPKTQMLFPV